MFELERARGPVAHILAPGRIVFKFSGPGGLTGKKGVFQSFFFASPSLLRIAEMLFLSLSLCLSFVFLNYISASFHLSPKHSPS